jgi:hypothetical protein
LNQCLKLHPHIKDYGFLTRKIGNSRKWRGFEILKLIIVSQRKIVNDRYFIAKSSFQRHLYITELPTQDTRRLLSVRN